ncbi:ABC transporter, ATP-binding protein [Streptococcus infantarius subsp. infantarius]|uniref:ABC transporter ATP-binding protein n=1 Tax=Streptococcus infantarius TaxID=102684 RepID=UPI00208F5F7D|nr:ABC transporter ATP-binding protein [Streptococcus infantarius]MCO4493824.1 ABC transporter, ATP-binding protein [Streptococcus infantarius subsp. infantarius]MCO4496016.1 ABC transporter, ATP-binding protein [Streptococcus infantarius subsp. infantarius]MCO4502794.1 ABC transporter, ATP-binding protein [Streptococcus infantarius subsp. infantarius]MCO4503931.1 ABC transporter, ATP-binding protein [Streptococcus infantarius subsp. infantarius]MCO4505741.1 ABC transporter, ATP-binding protei
MLIRTKDLIKTFGDKTVIEHLNLEVEEGKLLAYIGTNGAGKSTTMKMLTGLLKPTSGEIELAADLKIGMVFQESVLDEELTVLDNLKSRQAFYRKQDKAWLEKLIQLTGLDAFLNQKYGTLSGGQRRRVDIVRALLNKPNLLFLDEPTTGLDIQTRRAIWEILHRLQREENLTIFLTTHYLEEAENADMAYIIDHGKVLAKGSAKELKETYSKPYLLVETSDVAAFSDLDCKRLGDGRLKIIVEDSSKALAILSDKRTVINDFDYVKANINDVFLNITGREMA